MASAFIPNPENKPTVNHINGIKTDNRVSNLEWATHSEQIKHAYDTGLHTRRCPTCKVSDEQVINIVKYIEDGYTNSEISKMLSIPHYTIGKIRNNGTKLYTFKNIINKEKRRSKYSDELLHEICKLIEKGYRNKDIYKKLSSKYIFDYGLISKLKNEKRYLYIIQNYNFNKNVENEGSTTIENNDDYYTIEIH